MDWENLLDDLMLAWERCKSIAAGRNPDRPLSAQACLDAEARAALQRLEQALGANNPTEIEQAIKEIKILIFQPHLRGRGQASQYHSWEYMPFQAIDLGLQVARAWLRLQQPDQARGFLYDLAAASGRFHDPWLHRTFAQLALKSLERGNGGGAEALRAGGNAQNSFCRGARENRADYDRDRSYRSVEPQLFP